MWFWTLQKPNRTETQIYSYVSSSGSSGGFLNYKGSFGCFILFWHGKIASGVTSSRAPGGKMLLNRPPPPYDSMSNVFTASLITRFNACAAQWIYRAFGAFCLIRAWTHAVAYRGFLAPGAKMRIGTPPFSESDWQAQRRSPSLLGGSGRSPSHQRFWDLGAIGSEWSPFLNSVNTIFNFFVSDWQASKAFGRSPLLFGCKLNPFLNSFNTIFNSACQTGKGRKRSPSLLEGLGRSPSRQRFWEHLDVNGTLFWIALILFSTLLAPTVGLQPATPIVIVSFGYSRRGAAANDTGACRLAHIGGLEHVPPKCWVIRAFSALGRQNSKGRQNGRLRLIRLVCVLLRSRGARMYFLWPYRF